MKELEELAPAKRFVVEAATVREHIPRPMNFISRKGYQIEEERIIQVLEGPVLDEIQARNEKKGRNNVFIPGTISYLGDVSIDVEKQLNLRVVGR